MEEEKKILFLCIGNTCRSPMAEFICKQKAKEYNLHTLSIQSAGFCVEKDSNMHPYAKQCLQDANLDVTNFTPQQVWHDMLFASDIIFCMTNAQKKKLEGRYNNIYSSVDFIGKDILDPYGEGIDSYKKVFGQIEEVCDKLLKALQKEKTV